MYRPSPSLSKLKQDSIRHDSAKNKTVKTVVKENWQAVYRRLSNEIKVRYYSPNPDKPEKCLKLRSRSAPSIHIKLIR